MSELAIDNWLVSVDTNTEVSDDWVWEPGFQADRQLVYSQLGPYKKLFLRPDKFTPRFYHTLYPLVIEQWQCTEQVELFDGFCTIDIMLEVRFQATLAYAERNTHLLSTLNENIKAAYYGLALDIVSGALMNLSDGKWVQKGLEGMEKKASLDINEMLMLQHIQSQAVCKLQPSFAEFPEVKIAKENVYLSVLKKNFEFNEQQRHELFRQQQQEQQQTIEQQRLQLEKEDELAKLEQEKQALQAEHSKALLQERALQQLDEFEIKRQMYEEKVQHEYALKQIMAKSELKQQQENHIKLRQQEEQEGIAQLALQSRLKQQELEAKVLEYEQENTRWREVKDKVHTETLNLKQRQKQLEFDTDTKYKQRHEQQRVTLQQESYAARKKSDVYLKREIELLELEKQRLGLKMTIQDYKDKGNKTAEDK